MPEPTEFPGRLLHSGERQPDTERGTSPPSAAAISLATVLPDILAGVPAEDRDVAGRTLRMPLLSARDEDLADALSTQNPDAFDFLIVEGVVIKQTVLQRRAALASCWVQAMCWHRR